MEGPDSSYSDFAIHICWKVDSDARMEPPIHTEYLRSGGAMIFTFIDAGAYLLEPPAPPSAPPSPDMPPPSPRPPPPPHGPRNENIPEGMCHAGCPQHRADWTALEGSWRSVTNVYTAAVVTADGREVLTSAAPKSIEAVEAMCGAAAR